MFEHLVKAQKFRQVAEKLRNIAAEADDLDDRQVLEAAAIEYDRMAESEAAKSLVRLIG